MTKIAGAKTLSSRNTAINPLNIEKYTILTSHSMRPARSLLCIYMHTQAPHHQRSDTTYRQNTNINTVYISNK